MLNVPFLDRWPHIVNLYCRKTVAEPTEGLIPTSEELIEVDDSENLTLSAEKEEIRPNNKCVHVCVCMCYVAGQVWVRE